MDLFLLLKIWVKCCKNISKNLSGKYSQKFLDHAQQSDTDASKRPIQKTAEATGDLIDNKIAKIFKKLTKKKFRDSYKLNL